MTAEAVPPALRVPHWAGLGGVAHAFFGRCGGVSIGPWASLNLGERVGDDPGAVRSNWQRVGAAFPGLHVVRMRQVHGVRVVRVDGAVADVGDADAMFTATPGLGLAVLTADCVPLLGVAAAQRAVLVAHAGWRGTLAGVAAEVLAAARAQLGVMPHEWQIALGPAIDGCCYEVERRIGEQLVERWGAMPAAWRPAGEHGQLDLRAANRAILTACGVPDAQVLQAGPCTSCRQDAYFSHRRSGGCAGRQLSVVALHGETRLSD